MKRYLTPLLVAMVFAASKQSAPGSEASFPVLHNDCNMALPLQTTRGLTKRQCSGDCDTCFGPGYRFCPDSFSDCYKPGDESYGIESCSALSGNAPGDSPTCASQYGPNYNECPDGLSCYDSSTTGSSAACSAEVDGSKSSKPCSETDRRSECDPGVETTNTSTLSVPHSQTSRQHIPTSSSEASAATPPPSARIPTSPTPRTTTSTAATAERTSSSTTRPGSASANGTTSNPVTIPSSVAFISPTPQASAADRFRAPHGLVAYLAIGTFSIAMQHWHLSW